MREPVLCLLVFPCLQSFAGVPLPCFYRGTSSCIILQVAQLSLHEPHAAAAFL
jgi:hypothetical protein